MKRLAPTSVVFCLSADAYVGSLAIAQHGRTLPGAFVSTYLVHANWFAVQSYLIHDARRILCVFFTDELHKAIALMRLRDSVFGKVHVDYATCLQHEFPY